MPLPTRRFALVVATAMLTLLVSPASAWWCVGHMMVASIAKSFINIDTLQCIESVLHSQITPQFPRNPGFTEMACWADDLKSDGLFAMSKWHYIDMVYNPTNFTPIDDPAQPDNVITIARSLSDSIAFVNKWTKERPNLWELAFETANIIHFLGDIHQPLHTTSLFSKQFPKGDEGGNLFPVVNKGQKTGLHEVWDSACDTMGADPVRPLNQTWINILQNMTNNLIAKYGESVLPSDVNVTTAQMAAESHQYAMSYAYANGTLQPHAALSTAYLSQCASLCARRMVYAGMRLAFILNNGFPVATACPSGTH